MHEVHKDVRDKDDHLHHWQIYLEIDENILKNFIGCGCEGSSGGDKINFIGDKINFILKIKLFSVYYGI